MAVSKKNSRRIVVNDVEFRWRASGNDGWISVVVWPTCNDQSRLVSTVGYHHEGKLVSTDITTHHRQIVVTNRLVRQLILHFGIDFLVESCGQIDAGALETIVDIGDAIRAQN